MSVIYRISFNNVEEQAVQCDIEDIDSGGDTIIPIEGAEDAIRIQTQDNNEDKFTPIKAKKCVIKFLNSQTVNLRTFATGPDNRFLVTITINALPVFIGWLEQGDIIEPFQYQQNQIVQLTAIDGLAFLKDIRLTDSFDVNMTNEHQIITYIQNCLLKTGHAFNINVINNIREKDNPGHWQDSGTFSAPDQLLVSTGIIQYFKQGNSLVVDEGPNAGIIFDMTLVNKSTGQITLNSFFGSVSTDSGTYTFHDISTQGCMYSTLMLDAKTFEDRIGDCINCYDVLTRILGHDCFITQAKGEWWIVRVRELRQDFIQYRTTYNSNSDVPLSFTTHNYEKAVGLKDVNNTPFAGTPDATAYFSLARTNWLLQRPNKYARLLYNYVNPLEILCNNDFSRGDFIADLSDEVQPDGKTFNVKSYNFDCWEYIKAIASGGVVTPTTQDSDGYVKVLSYLSYEKERFVHLPATATNNFYYLRCTDLIPMGLSDRFNINISFKFSADLGGAKPYNIPIMWLRLYGDDGSFWNYGFTFSFPSGGGAVEWASTDSIFTGPTFVAFFVDTNTDLTVWNTANIEVKPLPVSGKLEVILTNSDNPNSQDISFSSLSLEYIPYVNGSYQKYVAQSFKDTQAGEYKPSIEEEVFISNSPKKLFKGALLKRDLISDQFEYSNIDECYEGQEFLYAQDGILNLAAYGDLQIRAFFNQYRNGDETYHAICQGLGLGEVDGDGFDDHQDIIHRVFNRDIEPATNNQAFQLVTQDIDLRNCEWTGTMIKNFDLGIGFVLDTILFRYETDSSNK